MALPEQIPTKISSESAGYVSMSPVARQNMPAAELIERILGLTGKDLVRVREILSRGTLVSGPSRYRWEPFDADEMELTDLLESFPDPLPDRPFDSALCDLIVLKGQRGSVRLSREVAAPRRWFKKVSYWDVLIELFEQAGPRYERYSYSERADVYSVDLSFETAAELQSRAKLLKYTSLIEQMRYAQPKGLEAFVERGSGGR